MTVFGFIARGLAGSPIAVGAFIIGIIFLGWVLAFALFHLLRLASQFVASRLSFVTRPQSVSYWPSLTGVPLGRWESFLRWTGWFERRHLLYIFSGCFVCGGIFALVAQSFGGLLMLLCLASVVVVVLRRKMHERQRLFRRQLPDALQSLVDTLRAGYSLPQAVRFIGEEMTSPIALAFQALARGFDLGLNFSTSLRRVSEQLAIGEWTVVAEALIAQQELGGNILPLLEEQGKAVRDRLSAEEEIKSATAAGRLSGLIIAILVPLVVVFFVLVSPAYISIMFQTILGRFLFAVAICLEIVGFAWIRRVTQIDF